MEIAALVLAVISLVAAALSIVYARTSAQSSRRSADTAEQALNLEQARLKAEAEHVEFTAQRNGDTVHIAQVGNGTAHTVTFSRNFQVLDGPPSPDTWTKGTTAVLWLIPPTNDDPENIVPAVSWVDSNGDRASQSLTLRT